MNTRIKIVRERLLKRMEMKMRQRILNKINMNLYEHNYKLLKRLENENLLRGSYDVSYQLKIVTKYKKRDLECMKVENLLN